MTQSSQGYSNCGRGEVSWFVLGIFSMSHVTFFPFFFKAIEVRYTRLAMETSTTTFPLFLRIGSMAAKILVEGWS